MTNPTLVNAGVVPLISLYDDAGHQVNVAPRAKNVATDATTGVVYGDLGTQVEVTTGAPNDVVATGTISADQSAVTAAFGAGVASWSVEATGTFSAGTTLIFEFQLTGSGSWYSAYGVPIGSTSDVAVNSVAGGSAITYQGNAAGFQAFRVRAHPFAGGDSVTIKIVGSVATDGGFVSKSLPPGTNNIGNVGIQAVSGTALVADQSNTELRVSNYGKSTAAGDTPLLVDAAGRVLIGRNTAALFTQASGATSGSTQNSSDLPVGSYTEISIDINTSAQSGTNPTIQYFYERKGADGIYYVLWQSNVLTAAANTLSTSIGPGLAYNQSLGLTSRLRWVVGGSATPTYTHSLNIYAK